MREPRGDAYDSNENLKTPKRDGEPPRPATEPNGAESSTQKAPTATDPGTGAPNPRK